MRSQRPRARVGDREAVDNRNYAGVQGVLGRVQRLGPGRVLRVRAGLSWVFGMDGRLYEVFLLAVCLRFEGLRRLYYDRLWRLGHTLATGDFSHSLALG
jgi:hypothetical protein